LSGHQDPLEHHPCAHSPDDQLVLALPVERHGHGREGEHKLVIWGMSAGVVLERILVDFGGIRERGYSYLGPPESVRL
jgi:hypothetical protein